MNFVNCPICGQEIDDICSKCLTEQNTCVLCFTKFELDEDVIRCQACLYMGHETNFTSWLQSEGSCPVCRVPYNENNFSHITLKDGTVRQHYLDKSSIYFKRRQTFSEFKFRLPYYDFQEGVVEDIIAQLKFDSSHLLVSPPGSGKTIIALSVASYFSTNTLVLTPNLAVLGSWIDRLSMFYDPENSQMKLRDVFTRSTGPLKPITISTYQQINTSLRSLNEDRETNELRKTPVNYIDRLADHDIGLLILDEAHRLTGKWGEDMLQLIEELGDVKVLGLTATPPQKIDFEFEDLFADRKTEIPLPLLVRQGVLVPYRDYAVILPHHLSNLKVNSNQHPYSELRNKLYSKTCEEVKFLQSTYEASGDHDYQYRWLSSNLSIKTWLSIEIILKEVANLGDDFRGLILMDQEGIPSNYPFKHKGTKGAIGIFDNLLKVEEIDELDPVFVTGKSLVIDKDFAEFFDKESIKWLKQARLEVNIDITKTRKQYAIVNGSGPDWNTETYTRYVTYLFEKGATKLLLGTRFLLGEGWDSQSLNTVVDLTTFATYASVNQAKGRALRKDPDNDEKVSHLWEIAPNPKLTPLSTNEYENYVKRRARDFGIDDQGDIRNGVDRVNPYLREDTIRSFNYQKQIEKMFNVTNDRSGSKTLWKVGQELGDLYYKLRFGVIYERKLHHKLKPQVRSMIKFATDSLISNSFNNYKIELNQMQSDEFSYEDQVTIIVPIKEDYNKIMDLEEKLLEKGSTGISLYINLYRRRSMGIFESLKYWIQDKPKDVYTSSIMVKMPWNQEIIDKKNLAGIAEPISFDHYRIKQQTEPLEKEDFIIIGPMSGNFEQKYDFFEFYDASIVQYYGNLGKKERLKPVANHYIEIFIDDIIIDQQYIAH